MVPGLGKYASPRTSPLAKGRAAPWGERTVRSSTDTVASAFEAMSTSPSRASVSGGHWQGKSVSEIVPQPERTLARAVATDHTTTAPVSRGSLGPQHVRLCGAEREGEGRRAPLIPVVEQ